MRSTQGNGGNQVTRGNGGRAAHNFEREASEAQDVGGISKEMLFLPNLHIRVRSGIRRRCQSKVPPKGP